MSEYIFKQGNFEMEKMINETTLTLSNKLKKIMTLDDRKGYRVLDGLEDLNGYMLIIKDLFSVDIKNCDLGKEDKININTGIATTNIKNCTISNELNINDIDLENLVIKDSYINRLVFYNCKNINDIFLYNTTINELVFNYCNIYQGILMNDSCVINDLNVYRSFIINYSKQYYNDTYHRDIKSSYDYIIDDRLIDVVKDKVVLNHSCIIEHEGEEAFNYYYNRDDKDIEPLDK